MIGLARAFSPIHIKLMMTNSQSHSTYKQGVPKSGESFINFIAEIHKTRQKFGIEGPITVHCSVGVGR